MSTFGCLESKSALFPVSVLVPELARGGTGWESETALMSRGSSAVRDWHIQ